MRRVSKKFNKVRLVLLIILFIALCVLNIIFKTQSRFRTLEEKNIVSVSEVPFYYLDEYDDNYFIDKDNNVYRLINKELSEISELKGAKKIIRTLHETIILMADNSLWEYDKDTNILKRIDGFDNCADISSGDAFFSVLNKDGTVWLSWDILNDDEYKGREMTKLSLPKKAVQIDCCRTTMHSTIRDNTNEFLLMTILDENGDVWLAGDLRLYGDPDIGKELMKYSSFNNIKSISAGIGNACVDKDNNLYMFDITSGYFPIKYYMPGLKQREDLQYNGIDKKITDIEMDGHINGDTIAIKTEDNTLYLLGEGNKDWVITESKSFDSDFKMYSTGYGTIVIEETGKITLIREENLFFEYNEINPYHPYNYKINTWDILSLKDYI